MSSKMDLDLYTYIVDRFSKVCRICKIKIHYIYKCTSIEKKGNHYGMEIFKTRYQIEKER